MENTKYAGSERNFIKLSDNKFNEGRNVCVGLDIDYGKIPELLQISDHFQKKEPMLRFNKKIIDATHDLVHAYKPNSAFYEQYGVGGMEVLESTIDYIHKVAPDVPVILDAKRADIDNTNLGYIKSAFDHLKADAITVHPYLGSEAMKPFLDMKNKGIIVLCRTSNKGAGQIQDRKVLVTHAECTKYDYFGDGEFDSDLAMAVYLYKYIAAVVKIDWNYNNNCLLVVGATSPEELKQIHAITPNIPKLIPGVGAQGGKVSDVVPIFKNTNGHGMIINSSRGIIYASAGEDFAEVARAEVIKLQNEINLYLQ